MPIIAKEEGKGEAFRHFRSNIQFFRKLPGVLSIILLNLCLTWALEKPTKSQLQSYAKDGSLNSRVRNALALENHVVAPDLVRDFRAQIERIRLMQAGRTDVDIDQDLRAAPSAKHVLQSKGTVKVFALLISFPDYPASQSPESIASKLFGEGDTGWPYESLRNYYLRSSYNKLDIRGDVLGWYTASCTRASMPQTPEARENLIKEALLFYYIQGHDFSRYDNNGDGSIDYFMVIWTGPDNGWGGFWWGYQTSLSDRYFSLNGKKLIQTRYSWLRDSSPDEPAFSPNAAIHETGHALGLPDYYDYADQTSPGGGIGGLDMMDGERGDHNPFSKMLLGWISPHVFDLGKKEFTLRASGNSQDALLVVPESSPAKPIDEFFLVQNRFRAENDFYLPGDGLLIWHVDARVASNGYFQSNNSLTDRKLLNLIEGAGEDHIQKGRPAYSADYFVEGKSIKINLDSSLSATIPGPSIYAIGPSGQVQSFTVDAANLSSPQQTLLIQGTGGGNTISTVSAGIQTMASGSTYYVDATYGSDSNSGLGSDKPWKTINKVNNSTFLPGDSVLLKRGETWRERLTVPSAGSYGNPITFGAYGTGALPIIDGTPDLTGWSTSGNWTDLGGNKWQKAHNSDFNPQQAYFNGTQYYMAASSSAVDSTHRWHWGSNLFTVYATSNPAAFYTSMKIASLTWWNNSVRIAKDYVDFSYIQTKGGFDSIDINNANHIKVHDCTIGSRAIYGVVLRGTCTYCDIYNNIVDSDFHTAGTTVSDYKTWQGDGIYTQSSGNVSYCNFYGNTIRDWCHTGIQLKGSSSNGGTHDIKIYQNTITGINCNHGRGIALSQNTTLGRVHDCKVYRNYIYNTAMANEFFGNDNEYYYNIIDTVRHDLYSQNSGGIMVWSSSSSKELTRNNKIYNNIIYNTCSYGIDLFSSGSSNPLTGIDVSNNLIVNWGMGYASYAININNNASNGPNTYKNNCFYKRGVTNVVSYRGTANSVEQFNAQTLDTIAAITSFDPLFVSASDFHLRAESPCREKGINVLLTQDFAGNPVPAWTGKNPDIGAYENNSQVVLAVPTVTTTIPLQITSSSAEGGGDVTSDGGAAVTERGMCWGLTANPTISGSHTQDGTGTGSYTSSLTGLTPGTTYHVRAYATNSSGTGYGNDVAFTTAQEITLPSVTISAVTSITSMSAESGGNVTSDGGAAVTERSVCWGLTVNPTISDDAPSPI